MMSALQERSRRRAYEEAAPAAGPDATSRARAGEALDWDWSFQGFSPGAIGGREEIAAGGLAGPAGEVPYREEMEARFGQPFDDVRAHTGAEAAEAATSLRADAFAMGDEVAFADAAPSRETVAHELTHVVQQRNGAASVDADERQADAVAAGAQLPALERGGGAGEALRLKDAADASELLTAAQIQSAIAFNEKGWKEPHRAEILRVLRAGTEGDAGFSEADVLAVAQIQKNAGGKEHEVDGKIGKGTMATLLGHGLVLSAVKVKPKDVKLLFYPGEYEDIEAWKEARQDAEDANGGSLGNREYREVMRQGAPPGHGNLYVEVGGNIVDKMEARGGPPIKLQDGPDHTADPSKAGTYTLGAGKPHVTSSWPNSQIAWGAELREVGGEIQYKDRDGEWKWATGDKRQVKHEIDRKYFHEDKDTSKPVDATWRHNDFGPISFKIQGSPGLYIHTTPGDEEAFEQGTEDELTCSHGCLHVQPADRDRLITRGYLAKGVKIVIKKYAESLDLGATNRK